MATAVTIAAALIVVLAVAEQPLGALTVTEYTPAVSPVMVAVVSPPGCQSIVSVPSPPTIVAVAEPGTPVHVGSVLATVTPSMPTVMSMLDGTLHGPSVEKDTR